MKTSTTSIIAIVALTSALAGYSEESGAKAEKNTITNASDNANNQWKVQAGWVHQFGRSMSVRGPSPTPNTGGRPSLSARPGLKYSDNTQYIPRQFDNGFVNPDLWTGDSSVPVERQGMTWFWGADNTVKYTAGANPTLTFSVARGEAVDSAYTISSSGDSEDDMPTDGIEVMVKRILYSWTRGGGTSNEPNEKVWLDMSLIVGMVWFPSAKQRHLRSMGQNVYGLSESYTYLDYYGSTAGGSNPRLDIPYTGTYGTIGGSDAGPLIPGLPDSATQNQTYLGSINHSIALESKLWRLRSEVGVEFSMPIFERLSLFAAPQLVFEFVDMSVHRSETSSYSGPGGGSVSQYDSKHKMGVYPGALLTAGANFLITKNWYIGASVGYEWLFVDPSIKVGPDKVTYDLNGGEASLYVGCSF
jgi:hypothetical protein